MDLHVYFLPFLAPGHMIPMVDLATVFAARGVKATIVTTTGNAHRIQPTIERANSDYPINLLTLPFSSPEDNLTDLPTPDPTPAFFDGLQQLELHFRRLLDAGHLPDAIVSDMYYPWTVDLGVPRIGFQGTSFFSSVVFGSVSRLKPHKAVAGDHVLFLIPAIPRRIQLSRAQLPSFLTGDATAVRGKIGDSISRSFGIAMNSFYELEPEYADQFRLDLLEKNSEMKMWHVGPVSLCNVDETVRGDRAAVEAGHILAWLDGKLPRSAIYVCFGSLGIFTTAQLGEMATGLEGSNHPFLWVVNGKGGELPEGFEERVVREGKGLVVRGWAPQMMILNHTAVGGFMTHCGWNSSLEGLSAGVPMVTWPLFAEQFCNEKLIVDVLGAGVGVGAKVCSSREEERMLVSGEEVRAAVEGVLGGGEEAEERRRRARAVAKLARAAVTEGGSSFNDVGRMIEDLMGWKTTRIGYSGVP